jgi:hypothetical protein
MPSHDSSTDLTSRCREYLSKGPPKHMTDYAPESLTEIIIAHGARSIPLDPELKEIGGLILLESSNFNSEADQEIRDYLKEGARLVKEVLANNS